MTIHCVSGNQNGKYLYINPNSGSLTTHSSNIGAEFVYIHGTVGANSFKLESASTRQILSFNGNGEPIWTSNENDQNACLLIEQPSETSREKPSCSTDNTKVFIAPKVADSINLSRPTPEPSHLGKTTE